MFKSLAESLPLTPGGLTGPKPSLYAPPYA
jgi:hypothetical protein